MANRFARATGLAFASSIAFASGLVLAAALLVAAPARAQGLFNFFDVSPGQVASMLEDDGYRLRGPLVRRGEVYLCDVTSVSGRASRLIVSAHDGRILQRFAASPRWRDADTGEDAPRWRRSRDFGDESDGDSHFRRRRDFAFDEDGAPSRTPGADSLFAPPALVPDAHVRPKPHAVRKRKDSPVAKAPAAPEPAPAVKPAEPQKPIAAVAPSPEPQKPETPVEAPKEPPKPAAQTKAEVEKAPAPTPEPAKPQPESHQKKINDLPVGTLE